MSDDKDKSTLLEYATGDEDAPQFSGQDAASHRRRDSEALTIIGGFFMLLAVLVLIGVVLEHEHQMGLIVGAIAGVLLLIIGGLTVYIGRRLSKPASDSS